MFELYLSGGAMTGIYFVRLFYPANVGSVLAYCALVAAWPLVFLYAVYHALRKMRDK